MTISTTCEYCEHAEIDLDGSTFCALYEEFVDIDDTCGEWEEDEDAED